MTSTGLSADPKEYRARLAEQSDEQIDAWASELMRDVAKRRGVIRVLTDLRKAADLSEADIERVFASATGPWRRSAVTPRTPDDPRRRALRVGARRSSRRSSMVATG